MSHSAKLNFVEQQGVKNPNGATCEVQYSALMFQPRLLGVFVLAALIFQSGVLFLILSAILWWNVFVPALNPFDAVYNRFIAGPKGIQPLTRDPGVLRKVWQPHLCCASVFFSCLNGISLRGFSKACLLWRSLP